MRHGAAGLVASRAFPRVSARLRGKRSGMTAREEQGGAGGSLSGRVALITGASGGIGQALARRLAGEGATVALAYGATAGPAQDMASEILATGGRAVPLRADLRLPETPGELVRA